MSQTPTQRFKKKAFMSQNQLDMFLKWRETKLKNEVFQSSNLTLQKNRASLNSNVQKKKSIFFKTLYLPVKPFRGMKFDKARFFPEKTPFIQFWVFPFLGACFLSFQTFQKPNDPLKHSNDFSFKETQNSRQAPIKIQSHSEVSSNQKTFFGTYSESKNKPSVLAFNMKKLCDFYLTLTEQNLAQSFEFYGSLQKQSAFSFSKTAFFTCQFRQNQFLQPSYSLCFENPSRFDSENLTQKIKLAYFYKDCFNRSIFETLNNTKNLGSFMAVSPIRSYYEASTFFDKLFTQLNFYNLLRNNQTNLLKTKQKNFRYFRNSSYSFDKTLIVNNLERLHALENYLQKLQNTSTISAKSFSNLFKNVKNNSIALKLLYVQKNDFLKQVFKNFPDSFEQNQNFIENFHSIYKYHLLKVWFKKQILQTNDFSDLSQKENLRSNRNKTKFFFLKTLSIPHNLYRPNKFTSISKLQGKEHWQRILNATRFLRDIESKDVVARDVLRNLKTLESLDKRTSSPIRKTESTDFSVISLNNQLEEIINDLIVLNTWGKITLKQKNSQTALTLDDRFTELLSKKIERSRNESKTNQLKNTKFMNELQLYRKLFQISSKLVLLDSKNKTGDQTNFEARFKTSGIIRYKTPIVKSSVLNFPEENMLVDKTGQSSQVSKNQLSKISIDSKMASFNSLTFTLNDFGLNNTSKFITEKNLKPVDFHSNSNSLLLFKKQVIGFKKKIDELANNSKFSDTSFFFNLEHEEELKPTTKFDISNFQAEKELSQTFNYQNQRKLQQKLFQNKQKFEKLLNLKKCHKRNPEKIFRTYLSVKFVENSAQDFKTKQFEAKSFFMKNPKGLKNQNASIFSVLNSVKKRIYFKKSTLNPFKQTFFVFNRKNPSNKIAKSSLKKEIFFGSVRTLKNRKLKKNFDDRNFSLRKDSKHILKKLNVLFFVEKTTLRLKDSEIKRFSQKKALQKKRRLKKLKLENRRRKKRKRFFPRPHSLRNQLCSSFLKKRHPFKRTPVKFDLDSINDGNIKAKILPSSRLFIPIPGNSLAVEQLNVFKNKIYRQEKNWKKSTFDSLFLTNRSLKIFGLGIKKPIYHAETFYKISNETLKEFEKLCWKSYWLRSNLNPYVQRVQKNLRKMKEIEEFKTLHIERRDVLKNFPFVLRSENSDFNRRRNKKIAHYLNVKQAFTDSFVETSNQAFVKILENKAEYDQLLYTRILNEIKNVKQQLNVEGQIQPRSYKTGRKKLEKGKPKNWFQSMIAFQTNYFEPRIPDSFDSNQTFVRSKFDDLPTLRVLWAFHKSHLFTYKENNSAKRLWSLYKTREQIKNNKTRKFLMKFFKFSGFSSHNLNKTSQLKTKMATKKIQALGGFVCDKQYSSYLRQLKFQLQKQPRGKSFLFKTDADSIVSLEHRKVDNWFDPVLQTQGQKQKIHFWWSTSRQEQTHAIYRNQFLVSDLNHYLSNNLNFLANIPEQNYFEFVKSSAFFHSNRIFENTGLRNFISLTFWISCFLFHLALVFSLIRIPEIRSLIKFQVLILSKIVNVYIMGLHSFHTLLYTYREKLLQLTQRFFVFKFDRRNSEGTNSIFFKKSKVSANFVSNIQNDDFFSFSKSNPLKNTSFLHSNFLVIFKFRDVIQPFGQFKTSTLFAKFDLPQKIQKQELTKFLTYTIPPFFQKKNKFFRRVDSNEDITLKDRPRWFTSWYTGFLWYTFSQSVRSQSVFEEKNHFFKELRSLSEKSFDSIPNSASRTVSNDWQHRSSRIIQSNIQIQSVLAFLVLGITHVCFQIVHVAFQFFYKVVFKCIDIFESILLLFYKFLEKPAELMVAWIADIYLIEWSSNITSYIPEAFDREIWNSVLKFSRVSKLIGNLPVGFLSQRFFLNSSEIFYDWLFKADRDLITRQKKGIIFWDVWAELLIQAAEKYKMNLSSLNTIRDEQQQLIENLIENRPTANDSKEKNLRKKSLSFFTSETFNSAITNMRPLFTFFKTSPQSLVFSGNENFSSSDRRSQKNAARSIRSTRNFSKLKTFQIDLTKTPEYLQTNRFIDYWTRWSVNQSLTVQGRDTELFLDVHPSKSFSHVNFLKTYLPAQEILGLFVCDIFSGVFQQKVSKNILIVGSPGTTKSFFVQALAGETELKIVIDNAHRYSFVNSGVPIGMKLLREVVESISLHTPCLFVLEDIHVIGERRPMLISDDETSKTKENTFGSEQDEIHEKNKLTYQLSRHAFSHYKKPYKGDFSMAIPTNNFCYDFFLGIQPPRKRRTNTTPKSPLPLLQIEKALNPQESTTSPASNPSVFEKSNLLSVLEISMQQFFAPPATSPFNILVMKEQKKLKPKKRVREIPWSGFSYDQYMLISKSNYSVRVKVALLAELAMTNLSMKLDMITDLLVIIDNVRSNRGFVVFGTTHVPSLLDPALRRPGRFDETISLPFLPDLMSRFEIFKTKLFSYTSTSDFLDYSLLTTQTQQNENQIYSYLSKISLLLLNTQTFKHSTFKPSYSSVETESWMKTDYSIYSVSQAFQTSFLQNSRLIQPFQLKKFLNFKDHTEIKTRLTHNFDKKLTLTAFLRQQNLVRRFSSTDKLNYLASTYGSAGEFLSDALILKDQKTYGLKAFQKPDSYLKAIFTQQDSFQTVYQSKFETKNLLTKLLIGKFSEFFVFTTSPLLRRDFTFQNLTNQRFEKTKQTREKSIDINKDFERLNFQTNPSQAPFEDAIENFQNYWQSSIVLLDSFFQKRFLYGKNQIVSKLLFFEDQTSLRQSPSPPNSSILMPSKKFENYQRTLRDFIEKPLFTINQKLQVHQKQRFLKLLYNVPVQKTFRTLSTDRKKHQAVSNSEFVTFYSSFKELGYLDRSTSKFSSSSIYYETRFLTRQRFSFLNQWWNGQLAEHTVETTYLSHVDWRSMFLDSVGDLIIDFPDADQYYNPRAKRWFLHSTSWNYWLNFEKTNRLNISYHYIFQTFLQTSTLLQTNREVFDYLAFCFLRSHYLREVDFIQTLIRFYKTSHF